MDHAQPSAPPYDAAFQGVSCAMPSLLSGEQGRARERPWNEHGQWIPTQVPHWHAQRASLEPPVAMPEPGSTAAQDDRQYGDGVDHRHPLPQDRTARSRQAPVSSIGTLKGPSGRSSASLSFWSAHSAPDGESSSVNSASSLETTATPNAASDGQQIAESEKRRSKHALLAAPFPWATCVPMAGLTALAAVLLLFVISIVVRADMVMLQPLVTQYYVDEGALGKSWRRALTANDSNDLVHTSGELLEGRTTRVSGVTVTRLVTRSARKKAVTSVITTARAKSYARRASKRLLTRHGKKERSRKKPAAGEYGAQDDEEDALVFPFRRPARPSCGSVFYTFCGRPPLEFHYRLAANACVRTNTLEAADLCNRGGNRFASLDDCLESCVSPKRPAEKCFDRTLFTRCARQDTLSTWWHHDGRKCTPWPFPSGGCPGNGSTVFSTAQECRKRCEGRQHGPRCRRPEVVACGRRHLKYPYFAFRDPKEGRVRCLRSSMGVLRGHRCLAGANRFRSHGACVSSCRKRPPSLG